MWNVEFVYQCQEAECAGAIAMCICESQTNKFIGAFGFESDHHFIK